MKINRGTLSVHSSAFAHGQPMPDDHSRNGAGVSPPLTWTGVPEGTASFAIVVHDPDAPLIDGWTHWVLYGIPADVSEIPTGGGDAYTAGVNSKGSQGWTPASPPLGHGTHHYYFHLYALNAVLDLPPGLSARELLAAIDEHVINQARVVGTYSN